MCCPNDVIPPPNNINESFDFLKLHRNFDLINVDCGINPPVYRLVGATVAGLKELPWM